MLKWEALQNIQLHCNSLGSTVGDATMCDFAVTLKHFVTAKVVALFSETENIHLN
jgi:hypothetical protein